MVKDITIGQYFPGQSVIHRMDPRMKLVLTLFFIIFIFVCHNFWSLGLMVLALGVTVALSRISIRTILRGIKPVVIIILFTAILNVLYIRSGDLLFDWRLNSCGAVSTRSP